MNQNKQTDLRKETMDEQSSLPIGIEKMAICISKLETTLAKP